MQSNAQEKIVSYIYGDSYAIVSLLTDLYCVNHYSLTFVSSVLALILVVIAVPVASVFIWCVYVRNVQDEEINRFR